MTEHYHIDVFWSDEDNCWIANVPDLQGCSAHGESPEEAMREIQIAMEAWLEVTRENGWPIPEARYRSEGSEPGRKAA